MESYKFLYSPILSCAILFICGCLSTLPEPQESQPFEKGYILYVFANRREAMIDFCKSDGISRGTRLDVFKVNMDEPVKLGEIMVEEVGRKMSKAKVTAITSSLRMEPGDRVLPHPIVIISDAEWHTSRSPADGWNEKISLSDERDWEHCEIIQQFNMTPEIRQFIEDTSAKPIWHPSVKSRYGDVFFRKVFQIDADPISAKLDIICGGRTNVFLNGNWLGKIEEAREWSKLNSFNAGAFLKRGKNLIAIQVSRDQRSIAPPIMFLAITIQTKFR